MKIVRLILLILHIGIFCLLLGVMLNAYIPPKIFPWFNILSLGFPLLIGSYILLTLFWLFNWKKRTIVFLLLALIFTNPVKRWVNYSSGKEGDFDLKVVSFNVKGGKYGVNNIEDYINSLDADIVLFQEYSPKDYHFKGLEHKRENLLVATFSKYKIIDQKNLIESDYETNNAYAGQTDIEIKGRIFRIINVYLQPFKFEKSMVKLEGNSEEDEKKLKDVLRRLVPTFKKHQEQIEPITKAIENSPYPVILAGDLNSVPSSYEYYHISEGLKDAFVQAGNGSATSFHDYKFPLRIDYIFSSETLKATSYHVDRSVRLSDHYPVMATFKIEK